MEASPVQGAVLAPLREDLALHEGPRAADGSASWTLHDPVCNRFFRIGWKQFLLLRCWMLGNVEAVLQSAQQQFSGEMVVEDVTQLETFLRNNQLLSDSSPENTQYLARLHKSRELGLWQWLLKNYLFFRIPLVNPDRLLSRCYPHIRFVFSSPFFLAIVLLDFVGLWLVVQQWDSFFGSFSYLYSWTGGVLFICALSLIKIIHELGHAFACKHYGLRVPSMGVAMLVMMPVLYTDATETWKLADRKARAHIVAAGVMAELVMAGVCCVLWFLLPEGSLRSAVFLLATTTWVMSLAINLNPLMRFDGYYLLSDLVDIPNLQDRSFNLARWQLRRWLFGGDTPPPEWFPSVRHRWLCVYAYAVWLYRFVLFLGIALLVYHYFFKVLGILLFAVEIYWFILLPIGKELRHWWQQRHTLTNRRQYVLLGAAAAILFAVFWPWQASLDEPALYRAGQFQRVFSLEPGRIVQAPARHGQVVQAGDVLLQLESPDLASDIAIAEKRIDRLQLDLQRRQTSPERLDTTAVLESELLRERKHRQGLLAQREHLLLTAPFAGTVSVLDDALTSGRWIGANTALFSVVDAQVALVDVYVDEGNVRRLALGNAARFYAELGQIGPVNAVVRSIAPVDSKILTEPYLASIHGGDIAVRLNDKNELVADRAFYRVQLLLEERSVQPLPSPVLRGRAVIEGSRRSFGAVFLEWLVGGVIRESGF